MSDLSDPEDIRMNLIKRYKKTKGASSYKRGLMTGIREAERHIGYWCPIFNPKDKSTHQPVNRN